jgi:hypothetical protein
MKIILSRKGFDSKFGGNPSPVFSKDNTFISLPIPADKTEGEIQPGYHTFYNDLKQDAHHYGKLVEDLTNRKKNRIVGSDLVHLDPDIVRDIKKRDKDWKPIFGQDGAAQGHLTNQGVDKGDIFLYFGLFRKVEEIDGRYRYVRNEKPFHMIWGWMQVGGKYKVDCPETSRHPWAKDHPHFYMKKPDPSNTVYVANEDLVINMVTLKNKGSGKFKAYSENLQLTKQGSSRLTDWLLPVGIYNERATKPITYHTKESFKDIIGEKINFISASIGQEFVIPCDEYPGAIEWVKNLIKNNS